MARPTLLEVHHALGVLDRAGMLQDMQIKRNNPSNLVSMGVIVDELNGKPKRKPRKQRRHKITEADLEFAEAKVGEDWSWTDIAKEIGCSPNTIAKRFD